MKRVIWHWTAGPYKATRLDKKHYHYIYEDDGNRVTGDNPISANAKPIRKGKKYAAHTYRSNTDSIGLSVACMVEAVENKTNGPKPMTETQFEAMMKDTAKFCKEYGITPSRKTTLHHGEVQANLGIKQRGKWDFNVLPFKPELRGARACGDYARKRVLHYMGVEVAAGRNERVAYLQRLLTKNGYIIKDDGILGDHTKQAINQFQEDHNLELSATFDEETVVLLRTLEKPVTTTNVSNKTISQSRTIKGGGVAGAGGAAILVEPVMEATQVIKDQQDVMSTGSIVTLVIGVIIILGAFYSLYARWDDAGRPKFWSTNKES